MSDTYNIYCDESSVDNLNSDFMVIGALFIEREKVPTIKDKIKEFQNKYYIKGELKWVKTSAKTLDFYNELFNYLFSTDSLGLSYKCIVVNKKVVDYKKYHDGDKELAFYKFYYHLLKNKLHQDKKYYIFLDFRPSRDKNRVRRLGEFFTLIYGENTIKHIQGYPSEDNIFIQLTDVITGAISSSKNKITTSKNKKELASIIANSIKKDSLDFCSPFNEELFNIFCIIPGKNK